MSRYVLSVGHDDNYCKMRIKQKIGGTCPKSALKNGNTHVQQHITAQQHVTAVTGYELSVKTNGRDTATKARSQFFFY